MRVLAFDAATETGWASFASARSRPVLGTLSLPSGTDYGERNLAMFTATEALIIQHRPDIVGYEAPFYRPRDRWHERRLLTGLTVAIELAATKHLVRCIEVLVGDAKACLSGDRRADKKAMEDAARLLGWPVEDDHQADAGAVALVIYGHLARVR